MHNVQRTLCATGISAWLALASVSTMADPVNIGFSETIGNSLSHTTDELHSADLGILPATIFTVTKNIHNVSDYGWTDFHITLEAKDASGNWVTSPESDGVSFGQIEDLATWKSHLIVLVNSVVRTDYSVYRDLSFPLDTMDVFFNNFTVASGDTLSIQFDMSDNNNNTWRLAQHATTVPEPGTLALVGLACLGMLLPRRRKTQ